MPSADRPTGADRPADRHLDPETLALLALGEAPPDDDAAAHLVACPGCRDEVADLGATVSVGRATVHEGELVAPPARVWDRISAELGLQDVPAAPTDVVTAPRPLPAEATRAPVVDPVHDSAHNPAHDSAHDTAHDPARTARTASTRPPGRRPAGGARPRRGRRTWLAAVAGVAAVALGGVVATRALTPDAPPPLASAELAAFPDWPGAAGHATLVDEDGRRVLSVTLDVDVPASDYREVWLLAADGSGLVSLGVLDDAEGTFAVPDDLDLAVYALVDVSDEPTDGDPGHSGDSIVRGELLPA
ncbi:anti-sigma factor [Cellulomonas marina]|uniref:Anti-sigma-K factor rskA n=1 Tax=Cellulomonas marina TaxID=988821 RepID=A0A1I0Y4J1_9CELL|nr:anti-sigma factor [Cellulomonas marina]GIG29766.1 hypothetical protein Cma02nite_23660 [Cellulomonas marina]SFB07656.1 Anti-sigma-K factor rskA [Cellulomonas marina]